MDDQTPNDITMETIKNKISNDELDNLVLNTIATIRKNKKRPDSSSIFDYLSKSLSDPNITEEILATRLVYLTENNKLKNKLANGKDSFYIVDEISVENNSLSNTPDVNSTIACPKHCDTPLGIINKEKPLAQNNITSTNSHLVDMTTFDAFYDDYIDFKSYVNDILNVKFKSIAESTEKELNGEENKTENENRMNLENKIQKLNEENVNLRAEVKSYEKVIQLLTSEKTNNENSWLSVPRKHQRLEKDNDTRKSYITSPQLRNFYDPLVHFERENLVNVPNDNENLLRKTKDRASIKDYTKQHTNKKRPDVCTTEKQIRNHRDITRKKVVPGNRSYASATHYGKKVFVVGDSHLKRINRRKFDYSLSNAKSYIKSFPGAKVEELEHYVIPHLQHQKPDATIIHIGGNNINYKDLDAIDENKIADDIINIGIKCASFNSEVLISSILVKRNYRVSAIIRRVNDKLQELCQLHNFTYISNDEITREFLCEDGVHLIEDGVEILAGNFVNNIDRLYKNIEDLD